MNTETTDSGKPDGSRLTSREDVHATDASSIASAAAPPRVTCPEREQIASLHPSVMQAFLAQRRWFGAKDRQPSAVRLAVYVPAEVAAFAFAEFDVQFPQQVEHYCLPLAVASDIGEVPESARQQVIAWRDEHEAPGAELLDAFFIAEFAWGVIRMLKAHTILKTVDAGEIVCTPTDQLDAVGLAESDASPIRWLSAEQSNSSLVIDGKVVLKLVRRVVGGIHPEAEMTRYLTARGYAHTGPLLGEILRVDAQGVPHTLCILQGFIPNEGDAWSWALSHLRQAVDSARLDDNIADPHCVDDDLQRRFDGYCRFSAVIGRRVGELHAALALPTEDDAFAPQTASDADLSSWTSGTVALIGTALDMLGDRLDRLNEGDRALAMSLLERRAAVLDHARAVVPAGAVALRLRIHGDLHLGQVLVAQDDAYLIDFEGEPARSLEERRKKASPLRDVAGMLRSLRYASATISDELSGKGEAPSERAAALLQEFCLQAEAAFLSAYRQALAASQLDVAGDGQTFSALLKLSLLEKAAYEIRYEAANRPTWIGVPLRGLRELVGQSSLGTS